MALALLVPFAPGKPPAPADSVLGRAAMAASARGIEVVFCRPRDVRARAAGGLEMKGEVALAGRWSRVMRRVDAGYVRLAKHDELAALAPLRALFRDASCALGNPAELVSLCRDKGAFARLAQRSKLVFAPCVVELSAMADALGEWRSAFVKPRWGARGRDVQRLSTTARGIKVEGDEGERMLGRRELADWLEERQRYEPQVLQRAVPLARGPWRSISIRSLVQRDDSGGWSTTTPVVRHSAHSVAGNVALGASVSTVAELEHRLGLGESALLEQVCATDAAVTAAIDAALGESAVQCVEVGIDYVPDVAGQLIGIEVNDAPQGRLEVLAERGERERAWHLDAVTRPMHYLASLRLR